uniref:Uncharacterized protein n=1 Tax=Ailuropoda melanoleuca TaxID=9646 RepID=A0A7N5J8A5_AILME
MTTRALQELDGGLGSRQAGKDLSTLADPCPNQPQEDRAQGTHRGAGRTDWPHVSSWGPGVSARDAPGVRDTLAKGVAFYTPWEGSGFSWREEGKETPWAIHDFS